MKSKSNDYTKTKSNVIYQGNSTIVLFNGNILKEVKKSFVSNDILGKEIGSVFPEYICQIYNMYDNGDTVMFEEEYCEGGSLDHYLKNDGLNESDIRAISKRLLKALEGNNLYNIVHRDIKPLNIFLRKKDDFTSCVLGDYGHSTLLNNTGIVQKTGTRYYMAPESIYNIKADIYSLGMTLLHCHLGKSFFSEISKIGDRKEVRKYINDLDISEDFHSFLKSCLEENPNRRISINDALNHVFIIENPEEEEMNEEEDDGEEEEDIDCLLVIK
ncbi:CAMK family protein kinase [Tritrichomonas foetus]|uniref:CAMK family protein kinase n=1 Tax=Tritrichomonas foetus TaxID=1144522 RepID=A0A1J4JPC8_9EUKA|nr:CAMK family protein kinase [Tritrichomonas foetus]|eukprot:OHS99371.1 CAMK family protein kinase [Tritrichomonas foetus]